MRVSLQCDFLLAGSSASNTNGPTAACSNKIRCIKIIAQRVECPFTKAVGHVLPMQSDILVLQSPLSFDKNI